MIQEDRKADEDAAQPNLPKGESGHFADHLKTDKKGRLELIVGRGEINAKKRIDHRMFADGEFGDGFRSRKSIAGGGREIVTSPNADYRKEKEDGQEWDLIREDTERTRDERPAESRETFPANAKKARDIQGQGRQDQSAKDGPGGERDKKQL